MERPLPLPLPPKRVSRASLPKPQPGEKLLKRSRPRSRPRIYRVSFQRPRFGTYSSKRCFCLSFGMRKFPSQPENRCRHLATQMIELRRIPLLGDFHPVLVFFFSLFLLGRRRARPASVSFSHSIHAGWFLLWEGVA